jgi:hypothetical protein
MKNLHFPIQSIQIGLQVTHRVFEYILSKNQNVENAYFYSQKSYYYYLEYMEQIHESNLLLNLNHNDAVLFVYKKTIVEFQEKEGSASFTNIMTLQNDDSSPPLTETKEISKLMKKVERIINVLFFWNHREFDFAFLCQLSELYLLRFIQKIDKIGELSLTIAEFIQEKLVDEIQTVKYVELIEEILIRVDKPQHMVSFEAKKNNIFLEKYYTNKDEFMNRFQKGKIGDFFNWMMSVSTGLYC